MQEVRYELVDCLSKNLLIIAPNRAEKTHARLPCVYRLLQLFNVFFLLRIAWILDFIDYTEVKEALINYFEKQMLLVNPFLFNLEVVRFQQIVHQLEVFVNGPIVEVLRQDDREEFDEL